MKQYVPVLFASSALLLAACGGGGGGGNPGGGGPPPTITPTATPTATPSTTTASGTLVDDASNTPLSGVQVALMPWTPSATPFPVATTNAQGQFSFTAPNGQYILIVGSNSANDTRATVHDNVTLKGGAQPLVAPTAWPQPSVTPPASEKTTAYRLMTLDTNVQTPCISEVNVQRAKLGLQPVVPDEWLEENAYESNQAQNNLNMTIYSGGIGFTEHTDQDNGDSSCPGWIDGVTAGKQGAQSWAGYGMISSANALWYGGAFMISTVPPGVGQGIGWEQWGYDPRIDTPCPSPPPNPAPPGGCDPVYMPWP